MRSICSSDSSLIDVCDAAPGDAGHEHVLVSQRVVLRLVEVEDVGHRDAGVVRKPLKDRGLVRRLDAWEVGARYPGGYIRRHGHRMRGSCRVDSRYRLAPQN